jgi:transposase
MVTCDEKWVYYDNQARCRSWSLPDQSSGVVAKRALTQNKVLLCVWWDVQGIIFYEFLKSGQTIDSTVYCAQLDKVDENLRRIRSSLINRKGVIFHQDNAKPHTSRQTMEKLKELGWGLMEHPPYSPDLPLRISICFVACKITFRGQNFKQPKRPKKKCPISCQIKIPISSRKGSTNLWTDGRKLWLKIENI